MTRCDSQGGEASGKSKTNSGSGGEAVSEAERDAARPATRESRAWGQIQRILFHAGRNNFLGVAYIGVGVMFILFAVAFFFVVIKVHRKNVLILYAP